MVNNIGMDQLGQYGSAYTDLAKPIIPPTDVSVQAPLGITSGVQSNIISFPPVAA